MLAGTGTRIQCGQINSASNRINTEVIPEAHIRHRQDFVNTCAIPTASGCYMPPARGSIPDGSPISSQPCRICSGEITKPQRADGRRRMCGNVFQLRHNQRRRVFAPLPCRFGMVMPATCRRGVHRAGAETRFIDRGRHQRHRRNKGFHQHRAVADKTRIGLTGQQFRAVPEEMSARGSQRRRFTGDGDEQQEREQSAFLTSGPVPSTYCVIAGISVPLRITIPSAAHRRSRRFSGR